MLSESIRKASALDSEIRKLLLALASSVQRDTVCIVKAPRFPCFPGCGVSNNGSMEVPVASTIAPGVPAGTILPRPRNVQLDAPPVPVARLKPPGSAVAVDVGAPCTNEVFVH